MVGIHCKNGLRKLSSLLYVTSSKRSDGSVHGQVKIVRRELHGVIQLAYGFFKARFGYRKFGKLAQAYGDRTTIACVLGTNSLILTLEPDSLTTLIL